MQLRRMLIVAVVAATSIAALQASAFERPFPPHAKRGAMKPDVFPAVVIDGKPRILTAGARILNTDNLIQMPASLSAGSYVVNYTEDDAFQIEQIWILTRDEAAQSPKQQRINQPRQQ
ncbi:MAG: hypothetical protein V4695_11385 [Pseudomonadota bacterium]